MHKNYLSPCNCSTRRSVVLPKQLKMQALQFSEKSKKLELISRNVPKIENPKHVLVKVAFSGICGTDLNILQGNLVFGNEKPVTMGHEFSGIIAEVGRDVKKFQKGDKVVLDPNRGCHICDDCRSANPHFCEIDPKFCLGVCQNGGWAEYVLAPEEHVYKLPENVTLAQGALTEPISCLVRAWDLSQPLHIGQEILIVGAGIAGILAMTLFHLQGHKKVTVSVRNENRRRLIEKMGFNFRICEPKQLKIAKKRFDFILDCTGSAEATEENFEYLNFGGKFCIYGVANPGEKISISPYDLYKKETAIFGAKINPFTFNKALSVIESMGENYLNYEKLGIKTFKIEDFENAIDCLKKRTISKAVFEF